MKAPEKVEAGGPIPLSIRMKNISTDTFYVYLRNTPFYAAVMDGVLGVDCNGKPMGYLGSVVMLAAPTREHWRKMEPGGMFTNPIEVTRWFAVAPGRCKVTTEGDLPDVSNDSDFVLRPGGEWHPARINCGVVEFDVVR